MKTITLTTSLLLSLSTAFAGSVTIPNTFTAGSPAVAADVNANFSAVKTAVDDNNTRLSAIPITTIFDYRDYLPASSITSKTFKLTSSIGTGGNGITCGDVESQSYARTVNGANTDIVMTRKITLSGTLCKHDVFRLTNTPTERLLKEHDRFNTTTGLVTDTFKLDSPITVRTSTMAKGSTFVDAATIFRTPAVGTATLNGVHTNKVVVSGIETQSITVPAGTYSNCLKIYEYRNSEGFGRNTERVFWFCKGVGMVKSIGHYNSNSKILELTATAP